MQSINEYIELIDHPYKEKFIELISHIRRVYPNCEEKISYGMPCFVWMGKPLVYLAIYPNHIGVYALPITHKKFESQLSNYKRGKGSVQFPISDNIPISLITSMIGYHQNYISNLKGK